MSEVFAYGFGIVLSELEFRNDASSRLFDVFSEKRQKKFIREWRKNAPELEWDRFLTIQILTGGPEKILAEVINENEFEGKSIVAGEKDVLYVTLDLPRNEKYLSLIPTEKKARDIIYKYVMLCYKGVKKKDIDYYFFEEEVKD